MASWDSGLKDFAPTGKKSVAPRLTSPIPHHIFGTFYFFVADGFENDGSSYVNITDTDPSLTHAKAPNYDATDLTYDFIRVTVHDL